MSLTKPEMWLGIIGLVLIFAFSIAYVGNDLANSDNVVLDQRSQDYVTEFAQNLERNDFHTFANNETLEEKKKNPLLDVAGGLPLIENFLGAVNFFTDKTQTVMDTLKFVYNIPTFFIEGFGRDTGDWEHVINIMSYIIFVAFIILMVRLVK